MKSTYYNELKSELQAVTGIKHVGRWVNQIELGNKITALPAVFIEILPIQYEDQTQLMQVANDSQVVLHLVLKKYTTEDTDDAKLYDLSQAIYTRLQNHPNFHRVVEALDVANDILEDFQLTYAIGRLVDKDAMKTTQSEDRPDPNVNEQFD